MLVKVGAKGQAVQVIGRKVDRISIRNFGEDPGGRQRFHVPRKPATYRVDITFERTSGEKLGRYSEYFRVMKARYHTVMTVNDDSVVPGQTIRSRIENLGTEPIMAELNVTIERYDGAQWIGVAGVYPGGKVIEGRTYVFGGETGPCFTYKVPADLGNGEFRVAEEIHRYLRGDQRQYVSGMFRVSQP